MRYALIALLLLRCASLSDPTPEHPWRLCQRSHVGGQLLWERVNVTAELSPDEVDVTFVDREKERVGDRWVSPHGNVPRASLCLCPDGMDYSPLWPSFLLRRAVPS